MIDLRERNEQLAAPKPLGSGGEKKTKFRADIAICDIVNGNGRYYSRSVYEEANKRISAKIGAGRLVALLGHPSWSDDPMGSLDSVAARWTKVGIEEREIEYPIGSGKIATRAVVYGEGVFLDTDAGRVFRGLIEGGVGVGISTNGSGVLRKTTLDAFSQEFGAAGDIGEDEFNVVEDYSYRTIDFVMNPSNVGGSYRYSEGKEPERKDAMHERIKELTEKLDKTLEEIKKSEKDEYIKALEAAVSEKCQSDSTKLAMLEAQILRMQNENRDLKDRAEAAEREATRSQREGMVDAILAEAKLPVLSIFKQADVEIDLNQQFRDNLVREALAINDEESAREQITHAVAARKHILGEPPRKPSGPTSSKGAAAAPQLPLGDNSKDESLEESLGGVASLYRNPYLRGL